MDLNRVTLIGHAVAQPDVKKFDSGLKLATFDVATNYRKQAKEGKERNAEVEFNHIVAWNGLAGVAESYITKGRKIYIEGRLRTNKWKDKNDVNRSRTEIIATHLILLDKAQDVVRAVQVTEQDPITVSVT